MLEIDKKGKKEKPVKVPVAVRRVSNMRSLENGCRVTTPSGEGVFMYMDGNTRDAVVTLDHPLNVVAIPERTNDSGEIVQAEVRFTTRTIYFDVDKIRKKE